MLKVSISGTGKRSELEEFIREKLNEFVQHYPDQQVQLNVRKAWESHKLESSPRLPHD